MTFILGTSKLSYDHFGDWDNVVSVAVDSPQGFVGDESALGWASPGCHMLCEEKQAVKFDIEVIP